MYGGRLGAKSLHPPLNFAVNIKLLIKSNTSKCMHAPLLSRFQLFVTLWTVVCQAFLSMGFSRQEYWSGLSFPSPGDLFDPGIEPASPLQVDSLSLSHQRSLI